MQIRPTIFILIFGFLLFSIEGNSQAMLTGNVIDASSGEAIKYITISLYKNDVLVMSTETDLNGNYIILGIDPGTYSVEASSIGYKQIRHTIIVKANQTNRLDFKITSESLINVSEVVDNKVKINSFPIKNISGVTASMSGVTSESERSRVASGTSITSDIAILPASGQMTVGEWNDLHNWADWLELMEDDSYNIMTERFQIYPTERYSVVVVNNENEILANIPVQLLNKNGDIIWETITDNAGKAELWNNPFSKGKNTDKIVVKNKSITDIKTIEEGSNTVILNQPCSTIDKLDVIFTVDATSSMSDEIDYLKSELLDVIQRIKRNNSDLDINFGSVFYRDLNDEYLTRVSPLGSTIEELMKFVQAQNASGGGDIPEAVDVALGETLKQNWRSNALKLNFLILDAPPRENIETLNKIRYQIKEAAKKGIKLIPITASGINRDTEFLMKFMAMMTNGTYVFITDDSGIGNPHLDPVVEDYEVEKLNDCIARLITEFSKSNSCGAKAKHIEDIKISIYPNPSTQFINVRTESIPTKIKVLSSSGMLVKTMKPIEKETRIELDELVNGVYTIAIHFDGSIETRQIILLK